MVAMAVTINYVLQLTLFFVRDIYKSLSVSSRLTPVAMAYEKTSVEVSIHKSIIHPTSSHSSTCSSMSLMHPSIVYVPSRVPRRVKVSMFYCLDEKRGKRQVIAMSLNEPLPLSARDLLDYPATQLLFSIPLPPTLHTHTHTYIHFDYE